MAGLIINDAHLLECTDGSVAVVQMDCTKNTAKFTPGMPDTVVLHYTAGRSAESSARYLAKPNVKASAHLVIGKSGEVYQLVPFDTIAWHAGKSSYKGRHGYNKFSIGIEIDNAGPLTKSGNQYMTWFGDSRQPEEVVEARHRNEAKDRYWERYTKAQIDRVEQICELLFEKYPAMDSILGHEEIAPGRKQDPGPAFPLDKIRNLLMFDDRTLEETNEYPFEGVVVPDSLNIREAPGMNAALAAQPLPKGSKVQVIGKVENWYRVTTEVEGWVAKEFIQL